MHKQMVMNAKVSEEFIGFQQLGSESPFPPNESKCDHVSFMSFCPACWPFSYITVEHPGKGRHDGLTLSST